MKKINYWNMLAIMVALLSFGLTSCKTIGYQVYEVKSPDLIQKNNSMVYENDECRVSYNLWERDGSVAFIFENKSDKDIFIDMSQTFFIKNGAAFDYYNGRLFEKRSYLDANSSYSVARTYIGINGYWPSRYDVATITTVKNTISSAVTTPEPEYICIPANAYKVVDVYKIMPSYTLACDDDKDFPSKQAVVEIYNENNSPLKFKNRIAYSFEESDKNLNFIENTFWLCSVKNYSKKEAIEKKKDKENCYSSSAKKVYYFKIGGPNQFYVPLKNKSQLEL